MVLEPECGGGDFQEIRESSGGSLRLQEVYSSPRLLLSGETGSQLDSMPWIRIARLPSTSADTPNFSQVEKMQRSVDHGHSFMDEDSMASRTSPAVDGSSPSSSTPSKHSDRSDFGETVAFLEQAQIDKWRICSTDSKEKEQIRPWWNLSETLQGNSTDVP